MDRKRISMTIEERLLKEVDRTVDGIWIKNRSHAIETLVSRGLGHRVNKALVLVGGEGTRLRPLTYKVPKPMLEINNRPMLEYVIENLREQGVGKVILSVGYLAEMIRGHFGDGSSLGVEITYVEEAEPMGTAGPLDLAREHLDETFLMLNGDVLSRVDVHDLIRFHRRNGGIATIVLTTVEDPSAFGVVSIKGNDVLGFVEKPKREEAPSNLINAGMYVLEPEVLDYVSKGPAMIEREVFPVLAREGKLKGYLYEGKWIDIGTPEKLREAIETW